MYKLEYIKSFYINDDIDNYFIDISNENQMRELAYAKALPFLIQEEKLMTKENWMRVGFQTRKKVSSAAYYTMGNTFYEDRTTSKFVNLINMTLAVPRGLFRIASLGMFNCDRMYVAPAAPEIYNVRATFRNEKGEMLSVKNLYTVYSKGVVVTNNPEESLYLRKGSKVGFMIVTTDGKVGIKKFDEVNAMTSKKSGGITIDVVEPEEQITNPQQLKKYVGF